MVTLTPSAPVADYSFMLRSVEYNVSMSMVRTLKEPEVTRGSVTGPGAAGCGTLAAVAGHVVT